MEFKSKVKIKKPNKLELKSLRRLDADQIISNYCQKAGFGDEIAGKLLAYSRFLQKENEKYNLTGKKTLQEICRHLISDSAQIGHCIDFSKVQSICDVGTGAGFPGIVLKILHPHLRLFLLEVNKKKIAFLKQVVDLLGLQEVEVCDLDWRTFNRKTNYKIDFFVTKAALGEVELSRMFRQTGNYKDIFLIYWASGLWECDEKVAHFVKKEVNYLNSGRKGKFVFFEDVKSERDFNRFLKKENAN